MNDDGTLHDATLQDAARRLGVTAAERLDVERTAQAVVARLRAEPRARGAWVWIQPAWLKIAAALVIVAGAGVVTRALWREPPGAAAPIETIDLGDLSAAQLSELLRSVERPGAPEPVSWQDVSLEDLSTPQLRALLASLDMKT